MKSKIYNKLHSFFDPEVLEVINESSLHANHEGSPKTGDSHYHIKIKSKKLKNKKTLESHRLIYGILQDEMKNQIHALKIEIIKSN